MTNVEHGTGDIQEGALTGEVLNALRAIDGATRARGGTPAEDAARLVAGIAGQSIQCRGVLAAVGVSLTL